MKEFKEYLDVAWEFHGHRCPAMPMGLRAGLAAMRTLGVERSQDKELMVEAETGKGHAAGCFLDGIMTATGCTYGKANIQKLYYNKMAFTLTDVKSGRSVRVSLKPDFFEKALDSPFVQERKKGVPPQDIPAAITDPLVERVLGLPASEFLDISDVFQKDIRKGSPTFNIKRCAKCGEAVFAEKLIIAADGRMLCIPCAEKEKHNAGIAES
jgi:formylmethanofuran dehydrogenase subunit E